MHSPTRRRAVDGLAFLLAAGCGILTAWAVLTAPDAAHRATEPVMVADQLVGAAACIALWWRRRWTMPIALALVPVGAFSTLSAGAIGVMLFTVAVHRPWRSALLVTVLYEGASLVYFVLRPSPDFGYWTLVAVSAVVTAATLAWGLFVRARRQLVESLRERARQAEEGARLRAERARELERNRIAREMHDVLAHRLSLLSLHAGALQYRPDAPAEQVAEAAGVVRESAHRALQELREVIGVLRAPGGAERVDPERPQPRLADLRELVAESRSAGMRVSADWEVAEPAAAPEAAGRAVYRLVQEALTNARKHAPGVPVQLRVSGGPGDGLALLVQNPLPDGGPGPSVLPGSGSGLVGMAERVSLAGGTFAHSAEGGVFAVRAWLPWSA